MAKLKLFFLILVCLAPLGAAVLPAGSGLEVRLLTPVGSRISHSGDLVRAVLIAPVLEGETIVLPAGTTVSGLVTHSQRLGLGLRHTAATLDIRFTAFHLADGTVIPAPTQLTAVEEAREMVSESGTVIGIHPTMSFSTGVSTALALLFVGQPELRIPALGFKFLAARSPDAEITFPAGTEMLLRVTQRVQLPHLADRALQAALLTEADEARVQDMLAKLPQQQTTIDEKHSSDVINVALIGTKQSMERAFHAAGWNGSEAHGVMALYHMYHCVTQRGGYSRAPMTELKLNSSPPDAAFQKSLDTFSRRHHIRLWEDKETGIWLGAATEDVKYQIRSMRVTHGTDQDVDNERSKIVNDLIFTGCVSKGGMVPRPDLKVIQEFRHSIVTDGDVAVLALNGCEEPRGMPPNPQKAPPVRAIRAVVAVAEDIGRSNPFSVLHGLARAIVDSSKTPSKDRAPETLARTRGTGIARIHPEMPSGALALR